MRKLPLILFFILLAATISSTIASYDRARQRLDDDLSRALSLTIRDKGYGRMKQDSIKAYRLLAKSTATTSVLTVNDPTFLRHIKTDALRPKAYIAYHITPSKQDLEVRMEAQANCSMAFVWGLSDQRLSFLFCLGTLLSLLLSVGSRRTADGRMPQMTPHLTPMQEQLMEMFIKAPGHRLTKQEICDTLWPNKDNAPETLYTTIRRLRNALRNSSDWEIESERGKSYKLKMRQ